MKQDKAIQLSERRICGICQYSKHITQFPRTKKVPKNLCNQCIENLGGLHIAKWRYEGVTEIQPMPVPLERLEQIRKEPLRRRFL
jgi:hypothetical protein